MILPEEGEYILSRAYIPEHIVSLMRLISEGEPFLIEDYVCFSKDDWLIFVGYPLSHDIANKIERTLNDAIKRFQPGYVWCIAPEVPDSLIKSCQERESDEYYKLDLQMEVKKNLRNMVKKASEGLTIGRSNSISKEHEKLILEFVERKKPSPRVRELYLSMPEYVARSDTSLVLSAWDKEKNLSAFYIVELAAKKFAAYVVGCYSRKNYVAGASDVLFSEMINLAKEHGKSYINLGLGVNEGIRRFKEKWGGVPFLKYEFCEYARGHVRALKMLRLLESKL